MVEIMFKKKDKNAEVLLTKTEFDSLFDKNCEVLSDEFDEISEEDFYLADALTQDGLDIEEFGI